MNVLAYSPPTPNLTKNGVYVYLTLVALELSNRKEMATQPQSYPAKLVPQPERIWGKKSSTNDLINYHPASTVEDRLEEI